MSYIKNIYRRFLKTQIRMRTTATTMITTGTVTPTARPTLDGPPQNQNKLTKNERTASGNKVSSDEVTEVKTVPRSIDMLYVSLLFTNTLSVTV